MLSNTSKYAVRAVIYLAVKTNKKERIGIKKIAEDLDIPSPFLGKILQILVRRKILSSTKGPNGGFGIGKNSDKITLYDIIIEMDGTDLFESCLLGAGSCEANHEAGTYCAMHKEFGPARQQLIDLYKSRTVEQLANQANNNDNEIVL